MSSVVEQVVIIAAKLHQSGITPSTALVKAKFGGKIPLPVLIDGMSRFKAMSDDEIEAAAHRANESVQNEAKVEQQTDDIAQLKAQMQQLLLSHQQLDARIAALESQIKPSDNEPQ
ncbi:hypothetical protein [Shewanella mangrovi]|uniref:hypothetical protein n=1 Tax=Shewanella mangrovi TaxID=1515746 RepID=UPI00055FA6F4|nr:hypothetical protein [Shewanella mangrovi]